MGDPLCLLEKLCFDLFSILEFCGKILFTKNKKGADARKLIYSNLWGDKVSEWRARRETASEWWSQGNNLDLSHNFYFVSGLCLLKSCSSLPPFLATNWYSFFSSSVCVLGEWVVFFFYQSVVDLQCSANFCCTAKWPIHTCIYTFFFVFFSFIIFPRGLDTVPLCSAIVPCSLSFLQVAVCIS